MRLTFSIPCLSISFTTSIRLLGEALEDCVMYHNIFDKSLIYSCYYGVIDLNNPINRGVKFFGIFCLLYATCSSTLTACLFALSAFKLW
jgi:hypothetical protein